MVLLWRWHRYRCWLLCTFLPLFSVNLGTNAIFDEPRPLAVWEDPMPSDTRPASWDEKNFGQWCRNFSMNSHVQCPQGSAIHWYYCCGNMNTECCVFIQTWVVVVFGSFIILSLIVATVSVLAYFDLLWSNKVDTRTKKPKQISKKYATVSDAIV